MNLRLDSFNLTCGGGKAVISGVDGSVGFDQGGIASDGTGHMYIGAGSVGNNPSLTNGVPEMVVRHTTGNSTNAFEVSSSTAATTPAFRIGNNKFGEFDGNVGMNNFLTVTRGLSVGTTLSLLQPDSQIFIAGTGDPPSNPTTPAAWITVTHTNGTVYKLPLYQ